VIKGVEEVWKLETGLKYGLAAVEKSYLRKLRNAVIV
jgi:hypothetical protein